MSNGAHKRKEERRFASYDEDPYDYRETDEFKRLCTTVLAFIQKEKKVTIARISREFPDQRDIGDVITILDSDNLIRLDESNPLITYVLFGGDDIVYTPTSKHFGLPKYKVK